MINFPIYSCLPVYVSYQFRLGCWSSCSDSYYYFPQHALCSQIVIYSDGNPGRQIKLRYCFGFLVYDFGWCADNNQLMVGQFVIQLEVSSNRDHQQAARMNRNMAGCDNLNILRDIHYLWEYSYWHPKRMLLANGCDQNIRTLQTNYPSSPRWEFHFDELV